MKTSWKHHGNIIETSYKPTKGDERVLQNLSEYLRVSQSLGEIEEIHKNVMESHFNAVVLCRAKSKWPEMWQCSLHPYLAKRPTTELSGNPPNFIQIPVTKCYIAK